MNSRRLRRRSWAQLAAVVSLLVGFPPAAHAVPEIVAIRGVPSSLSAEYGPAVPLGPPQSPGTIAVPTGAGVDFHAVGQPGTPLLGRFRTAGIIGRASAFGQGSAPGPVVVLFAGSRGVVAVDATDPSAPVAAGAMGGLGNVTLGAAAPEGAGLLAAAGSTLHFLSWNPVSGFSLRRTVAFTDGRAVAAVAARHDSFLVASNRPGGAARLTLTLYRMPFGAAAPESLGEFAFNGHTVSDLAWPDRMAFLADGNLGILAVDVVSRAIKSLTAVQGTKLVRSVDANDTLVVAAAEGRTLARYPRTGAAGDTLGTGDFRVLTGDPAHARLAGAGVDAIVASTYDVIVPTPPDESGLSLLEITSISGAPDAADIGATGRVRRVVARNGLAYVADYTGGLRIYRSGGAVTDSSLVGALAATGNARPVDIALDPTLPLVYLASGPGGLEVVQVGDPAAPIAVASMNVAGLASAVTVARPGLLAVAGRGINAGVTFVQVEYSPIDSSVVLTPRGSVLSPSVIDPRALAARDTVLFVADDAIGVLSIRFGNPDLPATLGPTSLSGARDLDLAGNQLLVATRGRGLQIVDVTNPVNPILRGEFATPPLLGVARNGSSAILFAGTEGALVVDVSVPASPSFRGPIAPPGTARDGWWQGDTLLVAASLGLERYLASPTPVAVPTLDARLDPASAASRAVISWAPVSTASVVGLRLYRDLLDEDGIGSDPVSGRLVNRNLLPPGATSAIDDSLVAGARIRYRLEALLANGSSVKLAEGMLTVASAPLVGRAYPNPFRPGAGAARLTYRVPNGAAGAELTLRVFDAAGRLVRETRTPAAPVAGFGTVAWDGRNTQGRAVPSGVYYLRLTGAGLDDSRAIVLLR